LRLWLACQSATKKVSFGFIAKRLLLVLLYLKAFLKAKPNKAIKHRSASLHWTAFGGRLLQRYVNEE
jgi:hypothetical protein